MIKLWGPILYAGTTISKNSRLLPGKLRVRPAILRDWDVGRWAAAGHCLGIDLLYIDAWGVTRKDGLPPGLGCAGDVSILLAN